MFSSSELCMIENKLFLPWLKFQTFGPFWSILELIFSLVKIIGFGRDSSHFFDNWRCSQSTIAKTLYMNNAPICLHSMQIQNFRNGCVCHWCDHNQTITIFSKIHSNIETWIWMESNTKTIADTAMMDVHNVCVFIIMFKAYRACINKHIGTYVI